MSISKETKQRCGGELELGAWQHLADAALASTAEVI